MKKYVRKLIRYIFKVALAEEIFELRKSILTAEVQAKMDKGYIDGVLYYNEQLKKDPSLREWIIKDNYLDDK